MPAAPGFRIETLDPARQAGELRALREQAGLPPPQAPAEAALDALSHHVLARADDGQPLGSARLSPERRIGCLAVLPAWRGRGVGSALLAALIEEAQRRRWPRLDLQAPPAALDFYARHGFLPLGARVADVHGGERQPMRRILGGAAAVEDAAAAIAASAALVAQARRQLLIYSRALDPGLLDSAPVLEQLRRFAVAARDKQVRVLLHDAAAPQRAAAPLLALAQRLPSVFRFREVVDPVDQGYAAAYLVNDGGGYYFRALGHRYDGETDLLGGGRARQLRDAFARVWERSRDCTELRALGW
ncbi:GNAT family N-acetyltransferase [Xanthomonas sp. NCPPB 2654]|uniref:GNAT family N-acetyltransferase n=1 Tax=unclassified Xanthomonas TaxID=2643310 RepID=UPI0021E02014|nr:MULTISPECIES: GNAT family N-acetyltransferase [unclassified Xanthomonas]MDL5367265.1 GNAT family N-acetyltransferase [Xanthomonas sp. NCPPB 2654]UYC18982.1 GNAT family N-acetyltransferase [Xanthomonas sp. CFBP 8443]